MGSIGIPIIAVESECIRILRLKEHRVLGWNHILVFRNGIIHAVFPRHLFKAFQICFLNGDTADSLILTDQFFVALAATATIYTQCFTRANNALLFLLIGLALVERWKSIAQSTSVLSKE